MSVTNLTDEQINQRLTIVEAMICRERDWKNLPSLNATFDKLLTEQVRRDLLKEHNPLS